MRANTVVLFIHIVVLAAFSRRRLPGTPFQFLDKYFPGNWNTTVQL